MQQYAVTERWIERQQNEQPKKSIFTRAFYRMKNRAKEISMVTTIIELYEISLKLNPKNSMAKTTIWIILRKCIDE